MSPKSTPLYLPSLSSLTPEHIEEAYQGVESFLKSLPRRSGEDIPTLIWAAKELVRLFGAPVRRAFFTLLCERKGDLYATARDALQDGEMLAVAKIAKLLATQFELTLPVAVFTATLAVKVLANNAAPQLCGELADTAEVEDKPYPLLPKDGKKEKKKPKAAAKKPSTRKKTPGVAKKPAASKPAAKKPAAKKETAASKKTPGAAKKPAAKTPLSAARPTASRPAAKKPVKKK
jgi:hypothetical protein